MLSSVISKLWICVLYSETLLNFLTIPLSELPWATTNTPLPDLIAGTICSYQQGNTRSIVNFRLYIVYLCLLQLRVKVLDRPLYTFCLNEDIFHLLDLMLEEGYQNSFSRYELVLFHVSLQFKVCLVLVKSRSVFSLISNLLWQEYSDSQVHQQRNWMFGWLYWGRKCSRHRKQSRFV